jgi:hypothetical protein
MFQFLFDFGSLVVSQHAKLVLSAES